jgi:hypothetical protein
MIEETTNSVNKLIYDISYIFRLNLRFAISFPCRIGRKKEGQKEHLFMPTECRTKIPEQH